MTDANRLSQADRKERFTILYNDCFDYVYSFVFARTAGDGSLTEEIVQETFTAAWLSFDKFQNRSSYRTWICSIAKNKLRENYRKAITREKVEKLDSEPSADHASNFELETSVQNQETRLKVLQALNGLNPLYRYVLIMKYMDGLSVREIARELGKTEKAVDGLLQRAKTLFEKAM